MRKSLTLLASGAVLAAAPALAQPTPNEERGMYVGDAHTNGVATVVTDRDGTHPQGYPGFAPMNRASGDNLPTRPHEGRLRHRRRAAQPS